jgi:hypothetical protein
VEGNGDKDGKSKKGAEKGQHEKRSARRGERKKL